jgi:hypothetical protein
MEHTTAAVRDEKTLRTRLDDIVMRKGLQDVRVGVLVDGQRIMLRAPGAGQAELGLDPTAVSVAGITAGCLAKSLTATLVSDAVSAGRVGWADSVADILECSSRGRQQLAGVTVRHLLDHSHGLDASAIAAVPYKQDGFIDVEDLCRQLDPLPLHASGELYSYSHVGAWFAGAILETIHGASYVSQLREQQLIFEEEPCRSTAICPATGADLTLTVTQWLTFAQTCMVRLPQPDNLQEAIKLPGWHPTERSIWRGWKHYGDGWLGHNANLADRSAILRINASKRLGIVIAAGDPNGAIYAALGVFSDLLPEFRNLRPPRLLKPEETSALDLREHVGEYVQARAVVDITMDESRTLRMSVLRRAPDAVASPARCLRPAEGGVFLAESGGDSEFPFVQFIASETSSASAYLWNGRQIWRRHAAIAS